MDREFAIDGNDGLRELIESAQQGEQVVLTENGRPVAKIVLAGQAFDPEVARAAMNRIIERSRGMRLDGLDLVTMKHEGHRY